MQPHYCSHWAMFEFDRAVKGFMSFYRLVIGHLVAWEKQRDVYPISIPLPFPFLALQVEVLGGGRIENDIQNIRVFGYSSAFGPAPHELAAALIQRSYPMSNITHSYSGY